MVALNDSLELFKGLFGLFLDGFIVIFMAFCGRFCWPICESLWHVQRIVLGVL